jgi:hypothetical protein
MNIISVQASGSILQIDLNNEHLTPVEDGELAEGIIGLIAKDKENGTEVVYSTLSICSNGCTDQAPK